MGEQKCQDEQGGHQLEQHLEVAVQLQEGDEPLFVGVELKEQVVMDQMVDGPQQLEDHCSLL